MKSGRPEKNGADEVLQTALSLTMATVTVWTTAPMFWIYLRQFNRCVEFQFCDPSRQLNRRFVLILSDHPVC